VDHGWHTGLVVRAEDVPAGAWPERADFSGAPYLEVAWGDREFYMDPHAGLGRALKAAVVSSGSVLHVVGLAQPPARYFAGREVVEVALSQPGVEALVRFIDAAHARGEAARASRLGPGLYGDSAFYPATERYSLVNTCNTWIAAALRAAGCPITPAWAVTAGAVLRQVRALGREAL
jgi:uncharacterized protein (TIGR02117 family)